MGRLDEIIARNKHPSRGNEKLSVGLMMGFFLLAIVFMLLFTDLGVPSAPQPPAKRVDGVYLRSH